MLSAEQEWFRVNIFGPARTLTKNLVRLAGIEPAT
jgi:hypothetical protein